jgi:hypothetical protein
VWLDYFDHVYCIHLPNDARREAIEQQFDSVGITDVTYIHAEPPAKDFRMSNMRRNPRMEFGCSLSHIKAAVQAVADDAITPIFFEDDVVFQPGAAEIVQMAVTELESAWDVLYLGGHPRSPAERISQHVVRVGTFSFAEAYAVGYPHEWINFWLNRTGQKNAMIDLILGEYAAANRGYCVYPLCTHQPPGISQISGRHDDKSNCLTKGWENNLYIKSA